MFLGIVPMVIGSIICANCYSQESNNNNNGSGNNNSNNSTDNYYDIIAQIHEGTMLFHIKFIEFSNIITNFCQLASMGHGKPEKIDSLYSFWLSTAYACCFCVEQSNI